MNICITDIYLVFLSIIVFYLLYSKKNEGFQATNTGYQADIEAIRNLSSIATQLTTNNQLTIPGSLNVTNELNVKTGDPGKQIMLGTSQIKFRGDGVAHYALDSSGGKFKISNVSGHSALNAGHINDCIVTDTVGNTIINGILTTKSVNNAVPNIIVLSSGTNANWEIPAGVFRCKVTCVGAGGGGAFGNNMCKGGGGGGGGLCIKVFNNLTPGRNATYTIGTGGNGGSGPFNASTRGGNTSFTWSGTTITANGGAGGFFFTNRPKIGPPNFYKHTEMAMGGIASGGDININGGNGSCGVSYGENLTSSKYFLAGGSSNGGNSPLGYGFGGIDPVSTADHASEGTNGSGYGGGGSGGYNVDFIKGGNGSNGVIIIEY